MGVDNGKVAQSSVELPSSKALALAPQNLVYTAVARGKKKDSHLGPPPLPTPVRVPSVALLPDGLQRIKDVATETENAANPYRQLPLLTGLGPVVRS